MWKSRDDLEMVMRWDECAWQLGGLVMVMKRDERT